MWARINTPDITLGQLASSPFALFERHLHPPFFDYLVQELRKEGLEGVETALGVGSAGASVPLIMASGGWTVVSPRVGAEPFTGAVAKRLRGASIEAGIDLIWRADDQRPHLRVSILLKEAFGPD